MVREHPELTGTFAALAASLRVFCEQCIAQMELEDQAANRRELAATERHQLRDRRRRSGIPIGLRGVTFDQLEHPDSVLAAAEAWADRGGGLLLTGEVGRGKTTIAAAACWRLLEHRQLAWTSAPLLFARLAASLGSDERSEAVRMLCARTALAIDDIDKARPSEYAAEQVFLAIDHRITNAQPLLVTSNLSPAHLAERWPEPYGPAIASRLVGYCTVVRVDGSDRRLTPQPAIERTARA